uniref:COMM domain containing 10 n=1 Tax=Oncorhynchus mykiss TaxID=8022 RepID=A0A8C7SFF6_ONCMY
MAAIITETQSIKEAVTSINTIELNKFSRLLSRILQKLHLKEERTFSEEEEQKLQSALSLDKQDLSLVLDTTAFILEQAVYHNVKPASLKQQLEKIHLSPEKAEAFCQAWTAVCPDVVEKVRQRIFAPKKVRRNCVNGSAIILPLLCRLLFIYIVRTQRNNAITVATRNGHLALQIASLHKYVEWLIALLHCVQRKV